MAEGKRAARSVPPTDDLVALFQAARSNARDLLADAERLAQCGSFPRAHALATLACEELGKGYLCLAATLPDVTPEDFWRTFYSHTGKLRRTHWIVAFGQGDSAVTWREFERSVSGDSGSSHAVKLRGLYVDYRRGRVLRPTDISAKATHRMIGLARKSLAFAEEFAEDHPEDRFLVFEGFITAVRGQLADPEAAEFVEVLWKTIYETYHDRVIGD